MSEIDVLTQRQTEVLGYVSKGFTNAEIGELIGLSPGTIKVHISAIIERLDVTNRTEATALWLRDTLETHLQSASEPADTGPIFAFDVQEANDSDLGGMLVSAACEIITKRTFRTIDLPTTKTARSADLQRPLLQEKLGISHWVSIDLIPSGETLSLCLTCTDVAEEQLVFERQYQGTVDDLLRIGTEIGIDLVAMVDRAPLRQDAAAFIDQPVSDHIWRGSYLFDKRTPEGLQQAMGLFTDAIKADPTSVEAHVGLANASNQMAVYMPGIATHLQQSGKAAAQSAVELDPFSGAAHGALGYAQLFGDWDFAQAERSLERAISMDPSREDGYVWASLLHLFMGRHEMAQDVGQQGMRLNPIAIANFVHLGHVFRDTGQLDRAIDHLSAALDMEPGNLRATIWMALCQADVGNLDAAAAYIGRAVKAHPISAVFVGIAGYVAGLAGKTEVAYGHLKTLEGMRKAPVHSPLFESMVHIAVGDFDTAIETAQAGLSQRVPLFLGWCCDPMFLRLKGHSKYGDVAKAIGVPHDHLTTPI